MLVSFRLQPTMSCEYICQTLQKAIAQYQKNNDISNSLLVIDIQQVNDNTNLIPKIDYKNSQVDPRPL